MTPCSVLSYVSPINALVAIPAATETHRPVPHHEIVQALVETLGFRHIGVVHDEYAVSPDGMKAFGVLDLETEMEGCRFSIGLRNSHDKSMASGTPRSLAMRSNTRRTRHGWHELSFDSIRLSLCKATLEIIEQQSAVVGKRPV
jgi:hypothetical protein